MIPLKQCLHFDSDSIPCLKTHRKFKALDKAFKKLKEPVEKSDWRGVIRVVWGSGRAKKEKFRPSHTGNGSHIRLHISVVRRILFFCFFIFISIQPGNPTLPPHLTPRLLPTFPYSHPCLLHNLHPHRATLPAPQYQEPQTMTQTQLTVQGQRRIRNSAS